MPISSVSTVARRTFLAFARGACAFGLSLSCGRGLLGALTIVLGGTGHEQILLER